MSDLSPAAMNAMQVPGSPLDRLRGLTAQPMFKKALPWLLGSAAIGGTFLAWSMLAPAPQRILYSQLDDNERAGIVATLDKAGIAYTIDNSTGTLTVGQDDLYKARMAVAQDGKLANADPTTALDSLPLGASRTMEGEHLRAAREHELQLTIQEIDGVQSARVHLAEASKSVFVRDDAPPSASVMVVMANGRQLSDSQVAAVVNLVAASVPGMSADAVRVVDQRGRLLSEKGGPDADRLELQSRMEDKLRAQVDGLLSPMLGQGNYTSEVQVELDMDQVTLARESYDKNGVVRSETSAQSQLSGGQPGTAGGIPGALSNTPPPPTMAKQGPPQGGQPSPAPSASAAPGGESSATRTYELGREVSVSNAAPGKIRRLSVAVAISAEAMKKAKPADLEQIKALVSAAVGLDPQRGDQVQVITRAFEPVEDASLPFYEAPWFAMVVRSVVALLAVLLVLLMGVRPLVRALKRGGGGTDEDEDGENAAPGPAANPSADPALLGRQVGLAQRIVEEKPEDALVALRALLGQNTAEKQA